MASRRYFDVLTQIPATLGVGLRGKLREGYGAGDLRADLLAGLVVGVVALPLSMALAIASGVAPHHGLYTTIVAGLVCAILGGSRFQVTGPTAAFTVILVPVVDQYGLGGLLVAGMLAGLVLIGMGLMRLGSFITFIPHPVTTGITAGIAVVLATAQLKDMFGLSFGAPHSYVERWRLMWEHRGTASLAELAIAALTLVVLIALPRFTRRFPAPLIALTSAAIVAAAVHYIVPGFQVATIGSRYHAIVDGVQVPGIPRLPPLPLLPWNAPGPQGGPIGLNFELVRALMPTAFAIAMLGAIESLLTAVATDGITGTKHEPNGELTALGIGNLVTPFFGGIPAVGAMARTATAIRAGARSPLASAFHALFILACTVPLAPLVAYLPMAALAALMFIVAKNMTEVRHFVHILRVAPRSDTIVLLSCFFLTVLFDMVLAVSVGVVLAALLFMKRMAETTEIRLDTGAMSRLEMPPGVQLYQVAGPLFFGAAQKAMSIFDEVRSDTRVVILSLAQVPTIDATGLVALETLLARKRRKGRFVILSGLTRPVAEVLERAHVAAEPGVIALAPDIDTAVSMAIVQTARPAIAPTAITAA